MNWVESHAQSGLAVRALWHGHSGPVGAPVLVCYQIPPGPHLLISVGLSGKPVLSPSPLWLSPCCAFSIFLCPALSPRTGIPSFVHSFPPGVLLTCCGSATANYLDQCLLPWSCDDMEGTSDLKSEDLFVLLFYSVVMGKPLYSIWAFTQESENNSPPSPDTIPCSCF